MISPRSVRFEFHRAGITIDMEKARLISRALPYGAAATLSSETDTLETVIINYHNGSVDRLLALLPASTAPIGGDNGR